MLSVAEVLNDQSPSTKEGESEEDKKKSEEVNHWGGGGGIRLNFY